MGGRNVPKQTRRDRKKRYSLRRIRLKKKKGRSGEHQVEGTRQERKDKVKKGNIEESPRETFSWKCLYIRESSG